MKCPLGQNCNRLQLTIKYFLLCQTKVSDLKRTPPPPPHFSYRTIDTILSMIGPLTFSPPPPLTPHFSYIGPDVDGQRYYLWDAPPPPPPPPPLFVWGLTLSTPLAEILDTPLQRGGGGGFEHSPPPPPLPYARSPSPLEKKFISHTSAGMHINNNYNTTDKIMTS